MNKGEERLCDFLYKKSGSFFKNLFTAIFKADSYNFAKLYKSFPEEIEAVRRYKTEENYWKTLERKYLVSKRSKKV